MFPVAFRYVWPSELDLMARIAGMDRGPLGQLATRTVHGGQRLARLGLGQALSGSDRVDQE